MGGSNDKQNLVLLTAAEHFLAHQLLVKMHPENPKLIFAAHMMTISSKVHGRVTNREYAWLKKLKSTEMSVLHKGKILSQETKHKMSVAKLGKVFGENNNFYGKSHSDEFKLKQSERQKIKQLGSGNNNAKIWSIKFPDGSINNIKCLKSFCKQIDVSVYRIKNNTVVGYELLGEII